LRCHNSLNADPPSLVPAYSRLGVDVPSISSAFAEIGLYPQIPKPVPVWPKVTPLAPPPGAALARGGSFIEVPGSSRRSCPTRPRRWAIPPSSSTSCWRPLLS
jgi:hypothetical protein